VFGKTNEKKVIWKGMFLVGLQYFHREPTATRKNHMLKPHRLSPIMRARILRMSTDWLPPMKSAGRKREAWLPRLTGSAQL